MQPSEDKQWRIENVRRLRGLILHRKRYKAPSAEWDHDHCAACWAKFADFEAPDIQHEGYATGDDYVKGAEYEWVCIQCFKDLFKDMGWKTAESQ